MKVDLSLARKVYERGLNVSGSERDWEAYHLAKDVLALEEALRTIIVIGETRDVRVAEEALSGELEEE